MSIILDLFHLKDFIDVLLMAVILYYTYRLMKESRSINVFVGILVFIIIWLSDVGAYCMGMLFGKTKLTPLLSPKKTVEGAVGAVVFAAGVGALYGLIFANALSLFEKPWLSVMILFACGSILAQIGDLIASAIKRNRGIKDYGTLIPGHGGIMDRFDSVIVTAPTIYYLILLLMK